MPLSSVGLRMGDVIDIIRVAAGLRLGATLCVPHQCQHCKIMVDGRVPMDCIAASARAAIHAMPPLMT